MNDLFTLKKYVAVVTGALGHLGTAICEVLAEAGAKVVVTDMDKSRCDIRAAELSKKYNTDCIGKVLDISSGDNIKQSMKEIKDSMGGIDILVNNAYFGAMGNIEDMSESDWLKGIDGSVNGVFRCVQAVIPYMKEGNAGSIVNIASMYGLVSPDPRIYGRSELNNPPNYGAGKAAVIQLTKYAACHLADENIRVNSISPGAFPNEKAQENKEFVSNLEKKIPLGRIGAPVELKGAVLFLASKASSYVTGTNISVDGGWIAW